MPPTPEDTSDHDTSRDHPSLKLSDLLSQPAPGDTPPTNDEASEGDGDLGSGSDNEQEHEEEEDGSEGSGSDQDEEDSEEDSEDDEENDDNIEVDIQLTQPRKKRHSETNKDSDVEMLDVPSPGGPDSSPLPPLLSSPVKPSPKQPGLLAPLAPTPTDDKQVIFISSREPTPQPAKSDSKAPSTIAIPTLIHPTPSTLEQPKSNAKSAKPSSKAAKKAPSRSPSPPPPPPVIVQTIRLEIKLGGPDNYEVNVRRKAKETGQREESPELAPPPEHVSDGSEDEKGEEDKNEEKPKKKRKKGISKDHYDTADPFIDDSLLFLDERTFFAQTKQQGFYVSSGEVALMKDASKTPGPKKNPASKKPKSTVGGGLTGLGIKSTSLTQAAPSTSKKPAGKATVAQVSTTTTSKATGRRKSSLKTEEIQPEINTTEGTRESPIALSDTDDPPLAKTGTKRKRSNAADGIEGDERGSKKATFVPGPTGTAPGTLAPGTEEDIAELHPDLQVAINEMRKDIAGESFMPRSRFPATIKPILAQVALQAIKVDQYDDRFFNLMPKLFPYNRFTMAKLIKRTIFHEHLALLAERSEQLLQQLTRQAKDGFAKAEEEWEKSVMAWDKRQEKARLEAGTNGSNDGSSTRQGTEEPAGNASGMDVDENGNKDASATKEGKEKDTAPHPPAKKFRMTDSMKNIVWELVLLSNECCRLENEKNTLEGSVLQVSEQGLRKVLYQKIVAAFPDGWMSSGQISRDVSAMKKRLEKENMENE